MIKLISCDMDGTLLNSKKELPNNIHKVIDYFYQKGILFVIASGRQYDSLKDVFADAHKKMAFISDNGGFIHFNDQCYANDNLDNKDFDEIVNSLKDFDVSILFSSPNQAYVISKQYYKHKKLIEEFYPNHIQVRNSNFTDKITKVAIIDETGKLPVNDIFEKFTHKYSLTKSEERWFDIMKIGVNKGKAIKMLQELKKITYDETMAFGDMMNDYEMMQCGHYSYAMENAIPEIKKVANYMAESNDNQGVIKALEKHFNMRF